MCLILTDALVIDTSRKPQDSDANVRHYLSTALKCHKLIRAVIISAILKSVRNTYGVRKAFADILLVRLNGLEKQCHFTDWHRFSSPAHERYLCAGRQLQYLSNREISHFRRIRARHRRFPSAILQSKR